MGWVKYHSCSFQISKAKMLMFLIIINGVRQRIKWKITSTIVTALNIQDGGQNGNQNWKSYISCIVQHRNKIPNANYTILETDNVIALEWISYSTRKSKMATEMAAKVVGCQKQTPCISECEQNWNKISEDNYKFAMTDNLTETTLFNQLKHSRRSSRWLPRRLQELESLNIQLKTIHKSNIQTSNFVSNDEESSQNKIVNSDESNRVGKTAAIRYVRFVCHIVDHSKFQLLAHIHISFIFITWRHHSTVRCIF